MYIETLYQNTLLDWRMRMDKGTVLVATRNLESLRGNYRIIKDKEYTVKKVFDDGWFELDDEEIDGNRFLPLNELEGLFYVKGVC